MPLFTFHRVTYAYPTQRQRPALDDFSLTIPAGEKIAVVGRNGSGKSTFFLHLNGLLKPRAGEVQFRGQPLDYTRQGLKRLRQQVALVFQNPDDQLFSASVFQDISFGPLNLGLSQEEARERVREAAAICDIEHLLQRPTHALSGGEKARVALAGVLAMRPDALALDELMASLDPWGRGGIRSILDAYHAQGKTILLITHDLSLVRHWATWVIVVHEGGAIFSGRTDDLLQAQDIMDETGLTQIWRESMQNCL
jgi:cobalt/nickel transport system ATP-binding protein